MELTPSFTPGNFVVNHAHPARDNDSEIIIEMQGGSSPIAVLHPINTYSPNGGQQRANARLFVAAKPLLEAANAVMEIPCPWNDGSGCIGYSQEQIALIRKGFMFALDRAYEILKPAIETAV